MNILVLHSSSDLYGASKILLQTVAFLSANGNKVIVVLSEEGPLASAIREKGITVQILRLGILRRKYFTITGLLNRFLTIRRAKKQLKELVEEYGIELIYSNTTAVLVGALVAKAKKVKHIWHIHEIIAQPVWFLKSLGWIVNGFSTKVIVVSEAVKMHSKRYINENKLEVVYNGIQYEEYLNADGQSVRKELNISNQCLLIGMVGRVHYWKGQNYFLKIAGQIIQKCPDVKFIMVGDAFPGYEYLYEELEKLKSELKIHNHVINLGYRRDVPQILAAMDIFVLPSILPDPLPTVVLEAMATGKPVVVTSHGGAVEMVQDGKSGFLIPWNDDVKAAEKIVELLENKDLRKEMGHHARKRAQSFFSEKAYLEKIEKLMLSA